MIRSLFALVVNSALDTLCPGVTSINARYCKDGAVWEVTIESAVKGVVIGEGTNPLSGLLDALSMSRHVHVPEDVPAEEWYTLRGDTAAAEALKKLRNGDEPKSTPEAMAAVISTLS